MDRGRGGRGGFDRGGRGGGGAPMGGDRYGPPPTKRGGMVPPQGGPMAKRGRFEGAQGANGYSAHPHPPRSVLIMSTMFLLVDCLFLVLSPM